MSRGVLLDIARLKGVDRVATDFVITPDDLEGACTSQRVSVESGDIVLIRTGHITWFKNNRDYVTFRFQQPGLNMACALWLHDREVAAVCADNAGVERMLHNYAKQDSIPLPLHMLCLRDMGVMLGELFDLEALAEDCAKNGVYTFLLSAPVLPARGGVGSPINPLALK
jgi:kynurenine formamidase